MKNIIKLISLIFIISFLIACENKGEIRNSRDGATSPNISKVTLKVQWPDFNSLENRSNKALYASSILNVTQSLRFIITGVNIATPIETTINKLNNPTSNTNTQDAQDRSNPLNVSNVTLDIPIGVVKFHVEAYDGLDGKGNLIGKYDIVQNIIPNITNNIAITLAATSRSIIISPESTTTGIGGSVQLTATAYDADGKVILGRLFNWSTNDDKICLADSSGVVSALSKGVCKVSVESDGVKAEGVVTISPFAVSPVTIDVIPGNKMLRIKWQSVLSATSYNIYWGFDPLLNKNTGTKISDIEENEYLHTDLTNGVKYYFLITSNNSEGEGTESLPAAGIPVNMLVYTSNGTTNNISGFNVDSYNGLLSRIKVTSSTGNNPHFVIADPLGKYLFTANWGSNNISMFEIDSDSGILMLSEIIVSGNKPAALVVDPTGRYLYAANWMTNNISMYGIDRNNGMLSPLGTVSAADKPDALIVDPQDKYLYVSNWMSNSISRYSIDNVTGLLTYVESYQTSDKPSSLAFDISGQYLYVSNWGANIISVYKVDGESKFDLLETVPTGARPTSITTERRGLYLYSANWGSNNISIYKINRKKGGLLPIGTINGGTKPSFITSDPTGAYLFLTNESSNDMYMYKIEDDGRINILQDVIVGNEPTSVTAVAIGGWASNNRASIDILIK